MSVVVVATTRSELGHQMIGEPDRDVEQAALPGHPEVRDRSLEKMARAIEFV